MSENMQTDETGLAPENHSKRNVVIQHDSNPFTTTLTGIKKLLEYNTSTLIGLIIFTIVAAFILLATIITVAASIAAYLFNHTTLFSQFNVSLPIHFNELARGMSDVSIISTSVLGLIILVWLSVLIHTLAIKLTTSSSQQHAIGFGELLKRSTTRVLPVLGLTVIFIAAIAIPLILIALLENVLGPIVFILAIIAVIGLIYLAIRSTFATFATVEGKEPITALRYSWAITQGHFFETVGVIGASAIIIVVPYALLNILSTTIGGPIGAVISLVSLVATFGAGVFFMAGFAERFTQLCSIHAGTSKAGKTDILNYLALIIYVLVLMILGTITPSPTTMHGGRMRPYMQDFQQQPSTLPNTDPSQPSTQYPTNSSAPAPSYNLN